MLYEMCMQKLPFDGESLPIIFMRIIGAAYDPVIDPYSSELKNLIKKCLTLVLSLRPTVKEILRMSFIQNRIKPNRKPATPDSFLP